MEINEPKRLTRIMDAALEDAFDVEETSENMVLLKETIVNKINEMITRKQNNETEREFDFLDEEKVFTDVLKGISGVKSKEEIIPRKKRVK